MRGFLAALAALLLIVLATPTAEARERRNGFAMNTNVFGVFADDRRVRRLRARRARLYRKRRAAKVRRASVRRAQRRRFARRVARTRTARRSTVRRQQVVKRRTTKKRRTVRAVRRADPFKRRTVRYRGKQKAGTIVVDTKARHLFYVLPGGKAIRYGVAVGKEGFAWSGVSRVRRKVEWPTWTPPREMIERKPELAKFAAGMPGGPENPLGARALYLFQGKQDTLYRIHGTNNPASIGRAASSGCIRMRNEDVAHLYAKVKMGAKVIVR